MFLTFNRDYPVYNHKEIEKKWQDFWEKNHTFRTEKEMTKPKYYCLDMFPYPSGAGLHVGHPKGYTANDIVARFKKANGYNVLHPMGWDAFGLPAENYAIKTGTHPRVTTEKNVAVFKKQIQSLGFSYDWEREINTTDPKYFEWTQWIFLKMFEKGLAYEQDLPINYCPSCKTGLANEEVLDGKCERCDNDVEKKQIRQWVLAITKYADRLADDVDKLDWPKGIKDMQKNWIGKSVGCEFEMKKSDDETKGISVYTTRIDTVFGVTYAVIAPDHNDVGDFITDEQKIICENYITECKNKSDQDRTNEGKEKTGVFTGSHVINPFNNEQIPLWIGDYVLGNYGTGAVMAVPAHDERDHEFAKKYKLKITQSINTEKGKIDIEDEAFTEYGKLVNSGDFSGLSSEEAKEKMVEFAEEKGFGKKKVNYRLRDWLFSRQRYWGEPIPLIHLDKQDIRGLSRIESLEDEMEKDIAYVLKEESNNDSDKRTLCSKGKIKSLVVNGQIVSKIYGGLYSDIVCDYTLPLKLPEVENFEPAGDGNSPLAKVDNFVNVILASNLKGKRETNTMPQWGGSCWYHLRYMDNYNHGHIVDKELSNYWGAVDSYVGGAEHAVLHLLYARFWHKFLFDIGVVPNDEPFQTLKNQGLILGPNGEKMSKSKGNVVNPDEVVELHGADTLRLYEMYMSEFKDAAPWDTKAIIGVRRFLEKSERLFTPEGKLSTEDDNTTMKLLHKTIKKVEEDIENYKFNTAIASLIILINNGLPKNKAQQKEWQHTFSKLLHPFAPHLAEELWERIGEKESIFLATWPQYDEKMTIDDTIIIAVQVLGKLRGEIEIEKNEDKDSVLRKAKENESIAKWIEGKNLVKEIYVPGKIVNFVIN